MILGSILLRKGKTMENTYNGEGNHELQAKGRQKFRVKTFESFVIEWKEKGRKVYNIVGPRDSTIREYSVVLNNGEKIILNTEGKWTISLIDMPTTKEKADRKNGKNRRNRTKNIENIESRWREKIVSITKNRAENQENIEKRWREKIVSITKNRAENQENIESRWREKIVSITKNRVVAAIINVQITISIVGTENTPMTKNVST